MMNCKQLFIAYFQNWDSTRKMGWPCPDHQPRHKLTELCSHALGGWDNGVSFWAWRNNSSSIQPGITPLMNLPLITTDVNALTAACMGCYYHQMITYQCQDLLAWHWDTKYLDTKYCVSYIYVASAACACVWVCFVVWVHVSVSLHVSMHRIVCVLYVF